VYITKNTNENQRIRESLETLHSRENSMGKLGRIGKLPCVFNQPELNKQDIKYQNRCITSNEIEAIIKSLPTKKSTGPNRLTAAFYQNCK
jgi:hypothetical protein